jgi:uncharacterized protein YqjF (DUF2071 family)
MTWLQRWTDVLFLHFALSERQLRPMLPANLAIDMYDGSAWLSYVFFRLDLRPSWLPNIPSFSSLYELNIRTYVRYRDQPGIYFIRMYADNRLAILASRLLTPLKYEAAFMTCEQRSDSSSSIICQPRNLRGSIQLDYGPDPSTGTASASDSLDFWLLERYRAFVPRGQLSLLTATVDHPPWQVSPVELIRYENNLHNAIGISLANWPALRHYSAGVAARFNTFETADGSKIAVPAPVQGMLDGEKEKVAGTGFEPATSRL